MKVEKSIDEINERIREGNVCVVTADEMSELVEEKGAEEAAREVDVVTTGTFGAMCSSGVFLNFGHSCLLYTSPSPRDRQKSRMPSSA